jgi:hypothetical protein
MSLGIPPQHIANTSRSLSNPGLLLVNASEPSRMTMIPPILKTKPLCILLPRMDQMRTVMLWRSVTKKYVTFNLDLSITQTNNSQLADMLPSKTIPEVHGKGHTLKPRANVRMTTAPPKKKARVCSIEDEEINDDDSPCNTAARNVTISPNSSFEIVIPTKVCYLSCYVYYFQFTKGP